MSSIDKIRPIFSTPLLLLKGLRVTTINTFVGGLIIGAIFSLIVNIATIQVQEQIQKQRILEAIENEILNNVLQANNIITAGEEALKKGYKLNFFYTVNHYSRDLWEQSSGPLQYLVQLDKDVQMSVILFYTIIIPGHNQMLQKIEDLRRDKLENCFGLDNRIKLSPDEEELCKTWNQFTSETEVKDAIEISIKGLEVLKKFHPTQDRLKSPFLRFIMGDKSVPVLSGK